MPVLINPLKKQPFDEITNFYDQPFATHHHGEILLSARVLRRMAIVINFFSLGLWTCGFFMMQAARRACCPDLGYYKSTRR